MPFSQCSARDLQFQSFYDKQLPPPPSELHFSGKIIVLCFYYVYDPLEIKGSVLPTPALFPNSPLSVPSHTQCKPLTRRPCGLPPPHSPPHPRDPLTSSCFSCCRRQLSKCLRGSLLSFSSISDRFPKLNPVAHLKTWTAGGGGGGDVPPSQRGDETRHIRAEEMQNNVRGNVEAGKICSERCQQSKHV